MPRPVRNYGFRPTTRRPATWNAKAPPVPLWLGPRAREVWERTLKELRAAGCLATADEDLIAGYCDAVAKMEAAGAAIDRDGLEVETPTVDRHGVATGQTIGKPHPMLAVYDKLLARVKQYASELGIGPLARARQLASTDAQTGLVGNKVLEIRERVRRAREQGGLTPPEGANDDE